MTGFSLFPTAIGTCGIAWRRDMVIATRLPDAEPETTRRRLADQTKGEEAAPPQIIRHAITAITALLEGERPDLNAIICDQGETDPFAVEVYALTRQLGIGETTTYGAIARQIGDVALSRRVGQTLGRNRLPIIVPCHRVMGADGKLTGFSASGGVDTKLRMLAIEGATLGKGPGLFDDLLLATKPSA
ncbi:MAG: methylated-DNA--[protein]-cysteine S-methyltransferase [Pseudomonadota bacterium]